jgi:hypothetical protein
MRRSHRRNHTARCLWRVDHCAGGRKGQRNHCPMATPQRLRYAVTHCPRISINLSGKLCTPILWSLDFSLHRSEQMINYWLCFVYEFVVLCLVVMLDVVCAFVCLLFLPLCTYSRSPHTFICATFEHLFAMSI